MWPIQRADCLGLNRTNNVGSQALDPCATKSLPRAESATFAVESRAIGHFGAITVSLPAVRSLSAPSGQKGVLR